MSGASWFEVDKKGLAELLERRGRSFVVTELIQNAWDEDVTNVEVSISRRLSDGKRVVRITDDSPEGFTRLSDAYTLFQSSKKKGDAEKRGRFNIGEKLVIALCNEAIITTTKGQVVFNDEGRKVDKRRKRPSGTCVELTIPTFTIKDVEESIELLKRLIPPAGVKTRVQIGGGNSDDTSFYIEERTPLFSFDITLPTEIDNGDGRLVRTQRKTTVEVFEPAEGFPPAIYELGIPVVDTDDRYVINVTQKVPLNFERDNVTPSYLRQLRVAVLNEVVADLSADDSTAVWVDDALGDERINPQAVRSIVTKRYGNKAVVYDPSDPEANKIAASQGYTVIPGRAFSKAQWENVRGAEAVRAAGQVTPSAKVLTSPDGIPPLDHADWTQHHHRIADYAKRVHRNIVRSGEVDGVECTVDFQHKRTSNGRHAAWYGRGHLTVNIFALGKEWLKTVTQEELDRLLIHEFGHYYCADHLSAEYYDALCKLGARLRARSNQIGEL
jgi:hypothetical protein